MRVSTPALLALSACAYAQDQVPLGDKVKGWFQKAQDYVAPKISEAQQAVKDAVPNIPDPIDAGASKVAELEVQNLNLTNWKDVIASSPEAAESEGPEEWLVYVTGGNKTCYGMCGNATKAWNLSVPLLSASPNPPHLAVLDCEEEQILCNAWAAGPPTVWVFHVPKALPDQSPAPVPLHIVKMNRTSVTASDIAAIHNDKTWEKEDEYTGVFHPFDGLIAKAGLSLPIGYALWGFSKMPSWLPMIAISFLSRSMMGRRTGQQARPQQGGAAPAGGR